MNRLGVEDLLKNKEFGMNCLDVEHFLKGKKFEMNRLGVVDFLISYFLSAIIWKSTLMKLARPNSIIYNGI